jgi:pimeloyl-ACP methyl ester carboxylesterase
VTPWAPIEDNRSVNAGQQETRRKERVVLVPGLGPAGIELLPLAARLRRKGYRVTIFRHFTGRTKIADSSRSLWARSSRLSEEVVHFVGHSLGGIVVLQMMADHPWARPGRIVTLATPHAGIGAARRIAAIPGGRFLLWPGVRSAAFGAPIALTTDRDLGVLAGNRDLFFGSLLLPGQESDMVVAVSEAMHPEHRANVVVRETHAGMLLSARVATLVDQFLQQGRFGDPCQETDIRS